MRKIIKLFQDGNVCVTGLRGTGKDMLFANVVVRRGLPYIGNTCYDEKLYIPYRYEDIACGGNNYRDFIEGNVKYYEFPYEDGTDVYLADCGVYYPAQYCNELNRFYPQLAVYQALCRQLAHANFHTNCQVLNRIYDKIREQSEIYIMCRRCIVLFGKLVIQNVRIYERYQSCVDRVPPYRVPQPLFSFERRFQWKMDKQRYDIQHGEIRSRWLIYLNKSTYDTRVFKEMLKNGKKTKKTAEG